MTKKVANLGLMSFIIVLLFIIFSGAQTAYAKDFVPKVDKIVKEFDEVYEGESGNFDILIKGIDKVQYKVWLNDKTTGAWDDITGGFSEPVSGNKVYKITTPKLNEGNYSLVVWAKRNGQTPLDKRGFDTYGSIDFKCNKGKRETTNINLDEISNNYNTGDTVKIENNKSNHFLYKFKVFNILSNKEELPYGEYREGLLWKPRTEGLYSMQVSIKYIEKTAVPVENGEKDNPDEDKLNEPEKDTAEESTEINESIEEENKIVKEFKEVEKEVVITKLIIVGDPFRYVGPVAPTLDALVVGNSGEDEVIYIREAANEKSRSIGYIYGGLQGVKILDQVGKFYYIEAMDYGSLNKVKGYVYTWQLKTVKPRGAYSVLVDLSDQRVYIFKDKELFKTIICSTGIDSTPTPTGTYLVGDRGTHFYTGYKNSTICYNWVRFNNNFLFHSVLFNNYGQIYVSEAEKLGTKASHGCIRVPLEDSKWIYDNIGKGSLVIIQN